jgi:hypothetical protein
LKSFLLSESSHFAARVGAFVAIMGEQASPWSCQDWTPRTAEYLKKFPEIYRQDASIAQRSYSPNPVFGSAPLRAVPALDQVLGYIVEVGPESMSLTERCEFVSDFRKVYAGLYFFHEYPITFFRNLLGAKFTTANAELRREILQLFSQPRTTVGEFSPAFTAYLTQPTVDLRNSTYFPEFLTHISRSSTSSLSGQMRFQEYPSVQLQSLNMASLELVALPFSIGDVVQGLLSALSQQPATSMPAVTGTAALFVILPTEWQRQLWMTCVALVSSTPPSQLHLANDAFSLVAASESIGQSDPTSGMLLSSPSHTIGVLLRTVIAYGGKKSIDPMFSVMKQIFPEALARTLPTPPCTLYFCHLFTLAVPLIAQLPAERAMRSFCDVLRPLLSQLESPDLLTTASPSDRAALEVKQLSLSAYFINTAVTNALLFLCSASRSMSCSEWCIFVNFGF